MNRDPAGSTDTFGRAIARLRRAAGYRTQKEFSEAIGRGGGMVSRIESGDSAGGAATFDRIVEVLDVDDQQRGELYRMWQTAKITPSEGPTIADLDAKLNEVLALLRQLGGRSRERRQAGRDATPTSMPRPALKNRCPD